jgi:deazaflavin-dependent oxidoreductase (nitroreductase family)
MSSAWLPPNWFIRTAWVAHRAIYSATGGRRGLRAPADGRWGMLLLRTRGRRSGDERKAILAYLEDGPNLVLMAMNGWMEGSPGWWLNLQARPDATVVLRDGPRDVHARRATDEEHAHWWARWKELDGENLDTWASRRTETAIIILEPRPVA